MKKHIFVNMDQIIASYMVGFNKRSITKTEISKWSQFLEKTLSNEDCKVTALYGERYLTELKREDRGFLFNIGESEISLAEGKDFNHLDQQIFSYVSVDLLLGLLNAPEKYKAKKENEELTF